MTGVSSVFQRAQLFDDLCQAAVACNLCERLWQRTKVLSKNNGNLWSKVLFVAEAPGRLGADRTGVPLYGDQAGRNFEMLLGNIGWDRSDVFITNALLCNPRDDAGRNDTPTLAELKNCSYFLAMTIELVAPEVVVPMGTTALRAIALIKPHPYRLPDHVAQPLPWAGRILVPMYHPGPRALVHRSLVKQRSDFMALAKTVHPRKGLLDRNAMTRPRVRQIDQQSATPMQRLILAIVQEMGQVAYFKLVKLLYLADLIALEKLGRTLTGEVYLRQVDGPWPPGCQAAVRSMSGFEIAWERSGGTPIVLEGPAPRFHPTLSDAEMAVLVEVLGKYGRLSNRLIKTAVYRTGPMRYVLEQEALGRDMRRVPIISKNGLCSEVEGAYPSSGGAVDGEARHGRDADRNEDFL
ncbi:MAG: uracil-DNA glycosylase family protein [Bacillota bacterium]